MALFQYLTLFLVVCDVFFATCASVKRNDDTRKDILDRNNTFDDDAPPSDYWWESTKNPYQEGNTPRVQNIEEEIINDLKRMDSKEKHRIFDDLKKQKKKQLFEADNISPLNIVELKAVQRSIKTPNTVLPTIRNKRTLNFLLFAVARAMGYALIPRNPDSELVMIQSSPCTGTAPRPPPCAPPPPPPPSHPPPTIPPSQIDANTIRYPYRPSQNIPLLQFAPLPPGVTVPYPPLLQWPCGPTTPAPSPNPCAPPTKAPPSCAPPPPPPPCGKSPPPSPRPPCNIPPKTPPCSPPPATPPKPPPPPPPSCSPPSSACAPPPQNPCPQPSPPPPPPPPPKQPPNHSKPPSKPPVILEYDHPVKIQIFSNGKKFLPASGSVYSGNPSHTASTPEKLEEYEKLDEGRREEDESEYPDSSANIFRDDEESRDEGNYDDGHGEIKMELLSTSRDEEDDEAGDDDKEYNRSERFYSRRMVSIPSRQRNSNPNNSNLIEGSSKERDYYTFGRFAENPKKGILKRVIKIRKPVTRQMDEYGNEYAFARSTVHEVRKRDLQDFDFIRKYKEAHGDATEDEHFRDENPPGRTTTSIKKIEVKKFLLNKSEDDPEEYHEKNERSHDEKPQKVEHVSEPRQHQEEHEEENGGEDEKDNYRQYEPPEYEGRAEIEKALQREIAREEVEEEEPSPRIVNHDLPPPSTGKGVQYVTKTITKYVGGSGGKETVRVVPIYKIVHVPPPLPPRPPPVKKIIHHHHHRIPVYPKIIVRTGPTVKRRPAIIAGLTHPGNVLLVTIRERNG